MSSDQSDIPGGRWARFKDLAGVGAVASVQRWLPQAARDKAMQRSAAALGNLRGLAAKAGQLTAYVDGLVPEAQRDLYETWMKGLMSAAPTSSPEAIRQVVESELGAPIEQLFAEWQEQPIASASIGQVHRARLPTGEEVVVKVQHPGIEQAMESDLGNAALVEGLMAMLGARKLQSRQVLDEFCDHLRKELDYELEARHQEAFRRIHATDPSIWIPAVTAERSTRRVLTSEYVEGWSFEAACAASEAERTAWCTTLWRFVFRGYLLGGMFNADPHPGNYIFLPRGRVACLDFGCVEHRDPERAALSLQVHAAAVQRDERGFRELVRILLGTSGGEYEAWALDYVRLCFEPVFASPFRITRPFAASMVMGIKDITRRWRQVQREGEVPLQPGMLFMNRLQCGFYSVLARLDATVDYAAVEAQLLRDAASH